MALFEWKNGTKVQNAVVASDGTTVQDAVWEGETPLSANNMNQAQEKMQDEYKGLIGELNDLNTTDKTNIVNAINEQNDLLFYKPGDTFEINYIDAGRGGIATGYLTSSKADYVFSVITPKSMEKISSITASNAQITIRQNGNYLVGSGTTAVPVSLNCEKVADNMIRVKYTGTPMTNAINNETVGIIFGATFTFN